MIKFISTTLLIALLSFAAGFVFPWWSIAFISFFISLIIKQKPGLSFLSGFLALCLLWGGLASWFDVRNKHILATRIAQLMINHSSHYWMVVLTALIGGVTAGFAALTASLIRFNFKRK